MVQEYLPVNIFFVGSDLLVYKKYYNASRRFQENYIIVIKNTTLLLFYTFLSFSSHIANFDNMKKYGNVQRAGYYVTDIKIGLILFNICSNDNADKATHHNNKDVHIDESNIKAYI